MGIKKLIKLSANFLGLENSLEYINYKVSFINKRSNHPRKKVFLFFKKLIDKNDLVFDVGANVGERVSIFSELGAKVVAIEPQIECITKLKKRFSKRKKIYFENVGLGEEIGEMKFFICAQDDRLSTFSTQQITDSVFSENTKWEKEQIVQVITLDFLIKKYGVPKFCKIDVEGYEINVLGGLTTPISAISFEFSSKQMDKLNQCLDRLLEICEDYKFNIGFGEPYSLHYNEWVDKDKIVNTVIREGEKMVGHAWGDIYARTNSSDSLNQYSGNFLEIHIGG